MADYIDRQAAIDAADRADYPGLAVEAVKAVTDEVIKELKKLTSTDAVEVVRCKDCENYQTDWKPHFNDRHYCAVMDSFMPVDGFCNYGERKDGNV